MDERWDSRTGARPAPCMRFVPDHRYTAAAALGAALALVALVLTDDGPSRLIAGIAVVLLLAYVVGDLVFSPRLEVSAGGVVIRAPMTRARLGWAEIDTVRADVAIRHGLRSTTLEIDAGPVLAVLSRRSLGHDPEQAAALIRSFRPPSPPDVAKRL